MIIEYSNDTIKVWEDGRDEMSIWFQLPMDSTTGENESLAQADCQQDCNLINMLIYNGSETVVIAVNRSSVLVIVNGDIRAGKKTL